MVDFLLTTPVLTVAVDRQLRAAASAGRRSVCCSLDLQRSTTEVELAEDEWCWAGRAFPYLRDAKDRTIYFWNGASFEPAVRFTTSLYKLAPTEWGPPTFEIDGVKMLPSAHVSPWADAERKVALIEPRGKVVLDACAGLGYFASWCLQKGAAQVQSYEKSADVIWLRSVNPWSPRVDERLKLAQGDVAELIASQPDHAFDAALHDPPRFALAGELYSLAFYRQLARVLKRKGKLFHYTGTPNKLTSGRDVPNEVAKRLREAGFRAELRLDGVFAVKL